MFAGSGALPILLERHAEYFTGFENLLSDAAWKDGCGPVYHSLLDTALWRGPSIPKNHHHGGTLPCRARWFILSRPCRRAAGVGGDKQDVLDLLVLESFSDLLSIW